MQLLEKALASSDYINCLHAGDDGYITIATKNDDIYKQYHYKLDELDKLIYDLDNMYVSMNSFFIPRRGVQNVRKLNALYIDIDYYNTPFFILCPREGEAERKQFFVD